MRKNILSIFTLFFIVSFVLSWSSTAGAKIEWSILNDISLEEKPLDVTVSRDGSTAYILGEKNILLFSMKKNKITETIPLKGSFSQITLSSDGEKLLLTDTGNKKISIIQLIQIYNIDIGESPVIGSSNAPATIYAFIDFQ